eukprot:GHVU01091539.1.p1 GENE.GHVU01091539.1~~GHVU01091539.1.p1  ORF type:complete len:332 (+),score=41.18 GHVU01091539.1:882-1877(+)
MEEPWGEEPQQAAATGQASGIPGSTPMGPPAPPTQAPDSHTPQRHGKRKRSDGAASSRKRSPPQRQVHAVGAPIGSITPSTRSPQGTGDATPGQATDSRRRAAESDDNDGILPEDLIEEWKRDPGSHQAKDNCMSMNRKNGKPRNRQPAEPPPGLPQTVDRLGPGRGKTGRRRWRGHSLERDVKQAEDEETARRAALNGRPGRGPVVPILVTANEEKANREWVIARRDKSGKDGLRRRGCITPEYNKHHPKFDSNRPIARSAPEDQRRVDSRRGVTKEGRRLILPVDRKTPSQPAVMDDIREDQQHKWKELGQRGSPAHDRYPQQIGAVGE